MVKASGAVRLLIVVSVVATGLTLSASPAAAAPGLTVTPATGLLDGQAVTVAGTGFTPGVTVEVAQCAGAWPGRCQVQPILNGTVARVRVRDDGSFTVRLRLRRTLDPATGADQGCAGSECAVAAIDLGTDDDNGSGTGGDGTERARVGIDFAASGAAPAPGPATLAITPTGRIRPDGVPTRWTGTGYDGGFVLPDTALFDQPPLLLPQGGPLGPEPGAAVEVCTPSGPQGAVECRPWRTPAVALGSSGYAFAQIVNQPVRPNGTVDTPVEVPRVLTASGERIDCAVEGCRFVLTQDDAPRSPGVGVSWPREWAPWSSGSRFVNDAYRALVGRAPTTAERSAAVADLSERSLTARTFLRGLAADSGGRRLAELTRLYDAALNRGPDRAGLLYWEGELRRHGGNMNAIASAFGRAPEFRRLFGPAVSNADAVDSAYVFTSRGPRRRRRRPTGSGSCGPG
jgi:hypothetical protein